MLKLSSIDAPSQGPADEQRVTLDNCVVHTGSEVHDRGRIVIAGTRIVGVGSRSDVVPEGDVLDLHGLTVTPGFIDLQVNGGGDVLFNDTPTTDALGAIVAAHARFGTTNMLPTYITGPVTGMTAAHDAVRQYRAAGSSAVLGIHFEGPAISTSRLGVHSGRLTTDRFPSEVQLDPDMLTLVTLAPEVVDSGDIADLVGRGALVAVGHSNATFEQAMRAIDGGARCATHLFNAMSPFTGREPGVVGAFLASDETYVAIIADGHHCHFASIRIALMAKPVGKTILVTDSMPPVGGVRNRFRLDSWDVTVEDGRCTTQTGALAGAALDMASAVRNCVDHVGVTPAEAFRMASLYPAELLGVSHALGRIRPGHLANLVMCDERIEVHGTVRDGTVVFNDRT